MAFDILDPKTKTLSREAYLAYAHGVVLTAVQAGPRAGESDIEVEIPRHPEDTAFPSSGMYESVVGEVVDAYRAQWHVGVVGTGRMRTKVLTLQS
jgi:hypothetical protein